MAQQESAQTIRGRTGVNQQVKLYIAPRYREAWPHNVQLALIFSLMGLVALASLSCAHAVAQLANPPGSPNKPHADDNFVLLLLNPDGTENRQLSLPAARASRPQLSPDGSQIAYVIETNDETGQAIDREIFVMRLDSSERRNLTQHPAFDQQPAWSPDGHQLAFVSTRDYPHTPSIYLINVDGSGLTRLTEDGERPSWSPDGRHIAFIAPSDGQLYLMETSGGERLPLTPSDSSMISGTVSGPALWSPDGQEIAFESNREGNAEIYLVNVATRQPVNITHHPEYDASPVWSPDGGRIAFLSTRGGQTDIWVIQADGADPTNLSQGRIAGYLPSWSFDGSRLAFVSDEESTPTIVVMQVLGKEWTEIRLNGGQEAIPLWLP